MHTFFHEVKPYGRIAINRNSDWSGLAILKWMEDGAEKTVEIPAKLLLRVGFKEARSFLTDKIADKLAEIEEETE